MRKLNHIQAALHAHLSAMHHTTSVNKSDTNSKITMFITGGAMGGGEGPKSASFLLDSTHELKPCGHVEKGLTCA